jgi:two-component sensor histidine kinase
MPMRDTSRRTHSAADGRSGLLAPIAWRATAEGDISWFSPEWAALTGQPLADSVGIGWMDCIHPEDRGRVLDGWHRARTSRLFTADVRLLVKRTGSYRWFRAQAQQSAGVAADDEAAGWAGTGMDVDDLHQKAADQTVLRATLHHRVRNTLAVIRSIARRSAEGSETVEHYHSHFDGRLAAFARTQSHIMRTGDGGVDLEGLLADELLANQLGNRVSYSGPEVRLPARLADQLGMALHELVDNAAQHGGLARDDGTLAVRWWVEGDAPASILHIDWREDVPDGGIVAPEHEGFGLELLTRSLQYEVDAEVALDFTPCGLVCSIRLPCG